jgi:hypothetical protein
MALPRWITPNGQLGIIQELKYYNFPLDAHDESGGELKFQLVSGRLPLGLQIIPSGKIQGVPVSELGGDRNVKYKFTIRVQNSDTGGLSDRSFSLTITNIAPPIIENPPKNSYLGLYLDGSIIKYHLEALEFTPGAELQWKIKEGSLPPGLSMTANGAITGYIEPLPGVEPGTNSGWDRTSWSFRAWDFSRNFTSKTFMFTVEVYDGVNRDQSAYTLKVFPRNALTADNVELTADTSSLETGTGLTVDAGPKHPPVIFTRREDFSSVRQGQHFSFKIDALDLDGDIIHYAIPAAMGGSFDTQDFVGNSAPYIATTAINNRLYQGVFPRATEGTLDYGNPQWEVGDQIKILNSDNVWQAATITNSVTVRLTGNSIPAANIGNFITQASSGANAHITNVGRTFGTIALAGTITTGLINTILPTYQIILSDNVSVSVGDIVSQNNGQIVARVTATATNSNSIFVLCTQGNFALGSGRITINGVLKAAFPIASIKDIKNITLNVNQGDVITQIGGTGSATVTKNITDAVSIPVVFDDTQFGNFNGNVQINGIDSGVTVERLIFDANPLGITVSENQYITQRSSGANARVTANVINGSVIPVEFISNIFTTESGNISVQDANVTGYPSAVICNTDITAAYQSGSYFDIGDQTYVSSPIINGNAWAGTITSLISQGISPGLLTDEGNSGFDSSKFDQGVLDLPMGLTISQTGGWIYGIAPAQLENQREYDFEVVAYKRDNPAYFDKKLYTLTVLGDLNNKIEWITDNDLGSIQNGKISDLHVKARHVNQSGPRNLIYFLTSDQKQSLPQGLHLSTTGLIIGKVSFELFGLDSARATLDEDKTTFDLTYHFTVTAQTSDAGVSASKTFVLQVIRRNTSPYENLYLRAFPEQSERNAFQSLLQNKTLFPTEFIYRTEDPYFGVASDMKTLFLPGLSPSSLAEYTIAASKNHFKKRLVFGQIKTAVALDANFNTKYEVVYVELKDENTNQNGLGPKNSTNLSDVIKNPFWDSRGNKYTTIYPNSFDNMQTVMTDAIGYDNKGALPDWMTSRQANGRVIGFTRALVLAYTTPGTSELIAYRLKSYQFNFNDLEFVVDRYQLDNSYSDYYNVATGNFLTDAETTFDRYPKLIDLFTDAGVVNYAVSVPFEQLNRRNVADINSTAGGLDGIKYFRDGETLVFAQQEFDLIQETTNRYNQGWANVLTTWDDPAWDYDSNISDNPYTPEYGYIVVSWAPNTRFAAGVTLLYNGKYYRVNESFTSGGIFELAVVEYGFDRNSGNYDQQTFDSSVVLSALTELPKPGNKNKTPGIGWDASNYVPGFQEYTSQGVPNQRAGIWQISIDRNQFVTLKFIKEIKSHNKLYVKNGRTYGSSNIFYDPVIKTGNTVPNYSVIPQQLSTRYTTFDGGGTRFFNYRNEFTEPGVGDKYIKFTKLGVFT